MTLSYRSMRVLLGLLVVGCESTSPPAPASKPAAAPPPPPNVAAGCPASKPTAGDACATDLRCTYGKWTCDCANWVHSGSEDNHRWYCSSCVRPDTSKPCTPGDACEQHNWERDEYFACGADGKWTCSSSSSNTAACAGIPRR